MSTSFIGEIEIGRKLPSVTLLHRIADALRLKPYELFFDAHDKRESDKNEAIRSLQTDLKAVVNGRGDEALVVTQ